MFFSSCFFQLEDELKDLDTEDHANLDDFKEGEDDP